MNRAAKSIVSVMGVFLGLAGAEHGVGEMLQGSVRPPGLMFESWPDVEFFRAVGGEPAMSVIPNMLAAGICTLLVSAVVMVWSIAFAGRGRGGLILAGLSILLMLVGGGLAPVFLGLITAAIATRINAPLAWWRDRLAPGLRYWLGRLWLAVLVVCLVIWLMMFPGVSVLAMFLAVDGPGLILVLFPCALLMLLLAALTAFAHDTIPAESTRQ